MRILIVDDTRRARQSMIALLEVWHQLEEVREATNGVEAVRLVEEFQDHRHIDLSGLPGTCPVGWCGRLRL
jgi:YesN/AraC family two-component response regulator